MNGDAAINLLMLRLGNRSDATLRSGVLSEMVLAQETRLERLDFKPWFLWVDDETSTDTVVDQEWVALPADFLAFDDDWGGVFWKDTTITAGDSWRRVAKGTYRLFKDDYEGEAGGDPKLFDLINARLYFRPIPNAVRDLRLLYVKKDVAPTDTAAANLWLAHAPDLLIAEAGRLLTGTYLKDVERAGAFGQEAQMAKGHLLMQHEVRKTAMQTVVMAGS